VASRTDVKGKGRTAPDDARRLRRARPARDLTPLAPLSNEAAAAFDPEPTHSPIAFDADEPAHTPITPAAPEPTHTPAAAEPTHAPAAAEPTYTTAAYHRSIINLIKILKAMAHGKNRKTINDFVRRVTPERLARCFAIDVETINNAVKGIVDTRQGWCAIGGPEKYKPNVPGRGAYLVAQLSEDRRWRFYPGSGKFRLRAAAHAKQRALKQVAWFKPVIMPLPKKLWKAYTGRSVLFYHTRHASALTSRKAAVYKRRREFIAYCARRCAEQALHVLLRINMDGDWAAAVDEYNIQVSNRPRHLALRGNKLNAVMPGK
jgi:hypothetical protein